MKYVPFIVFLIILGACKKEDNFEKLDVSQDIVIPKHYVVSKAASPLVIDGLATEKSWDKAVYTDNFIDIEGVKTPKFNTKVKMLWDTDYLYLFAEIQEPHIWGDITKRDAVIFYNNDFEVFIDPTGEAKEYAELEINALNTVWDLKLNKPYRVGGKADNNWDLKGLKSAIKIQGTLNNPSDIDSLWTVEMAIPLASICKFNKDSNLPSEGMQWRINFSRVEWDFDLTEKGYHRKKVNNKYLKEYNWVWSNQKEINMHAPEKWGYVQFTEAQNPKNVKFIEDKDLLIKQTAFALFRKTHFGDLKYLLKKGTDFNQVFEVKYEPNKTVKVLFNKTEDGFNFKLNSAQNIYIINEEGYLKKA